MVTDPAPPPPTEAAAAGAGRALDVLAAGACVDDGGAEYWLALE
jgi:hypothetical protein